MKNKRWQRQISLFWVLQIVGWSGYALDRFLSERVFFPVFFTYIVIAFLLTLGLRPVYHWLWSTRPRILTVGLVALFCSILAGLFWLLLSDLFFHLVHIRPYPDKPLLVYLKDTARYTLVHHKPFLFLSWSVLYFGFKYWQDGQRKEERALRATSLAQEAELQMLRYQLNPHFLFNSLNSASALIHEDPPRAERMINQLSDFLRYSLVGARRNLIPLKVELEAARNYLDVEAIRYEDKLAVTFDVEPGAENFPVPSLLLHPLIENAVKYGMQTSPLPLSIEVIAGRRGDTLRMEVRNTGRWVGDEHKDTYPSQNGAGIGVQNVRQRLQLAFPDRHTFSVFERDGSVHSVMEMTREESRDE